MNKIKIAVLVFLMVAASNCGSAFTIGVYFDNNGYSACVDSALEYPYITRAYIIAKDVDFVGGLAGWEAKIIADSTLTLIPGDINGDELNMGAFPTYQVGLKNALVGSTVLLADFTVIAYEAGSIFIRGIDSPSVPSLLVPIAIPAANVGVLLPAEYEYGGVDHPVAGIGDSMCPESNDYLEMINEFPEIPGLTKYTPEELMITHLNITVDDAKNVGDNIILSSDACFIGELRNTRYCTYQRDQSKAVVGFALCEFRVIEDLWGVSSDIVQAYVPNTDVPGLVSYSKKFYPDISHTQVGTQFIVTCNWKYGGLWAEPWSILEINPSQKSLYHNVAGQLDEIARSHITDMQIRNVFNRADAIVCAKLATSQKDGLIRIGDTIVFDSIAKHSPVTTLKVVLGCGGDVVDDRYRNITLDSESVYLLALKMCSDGLYSLFNGARGILIYNQDGLTTISGYKDNAITKLLSHDRGGE